MGKNPEDQFDMSDFNIGDNAYNDSADRHGQASSETEAYTNPEKKIVNLTSDIPVQIVAVLGKKSVTVKDVVSMKMGQVLELGKMPNEAIDLVANGKLIAKGELVEIDGRLGVRILKIFDSY
ncbi:MAG: FliM/FliN family flagellar motor switch protein [Deltaproteobacteria bacterium]|nr:FliM/FliN family flagellar motor switch protein [Deltaproteobacteria bacterium]